MRITKRQLRRIIKEAASRKAINSLKDAAADAVVKRSSIGRAVGISVREDKGFQVQWDTEYAFKVTIRDAMGQREQWLVVGDVETGNVSVVGQLK